MQKISISFDDNVRESLNIKKKERILYYVYYVNTILSNSRI